MKGDGPGKTPGRPPRTKTFAKELWKNSLLVSEARSGSAEPDSVDVLELCFQDRICDRRELERAEDSLQIPSGSPGASEKGTC